jgi:hypothetical protein
MRLLFLALGLAAASLAVSPALAQPETCSRKSLVAIDPGSLQKMVDSHKEWLDTRGGSTSKGDRLVLQYFDLHGVDLHGKHLESADLTGSKLEGANLEGTQFAQAKLVCAQLTSAKLKSANLFAADLENADLTAVQAEKATFDSSILRRTSLDGANLTDDRIRKANLQGASLIGTALAGADLAGTEVSRAIWRPISVPGAGGVASMTGAESLVAYPPGARESFEHRNYSGLTMLAKSLKDGGQAELERIVLGIREREKTRDERNSDEWFDPIVAQFRTVLLGWLIDYGRSPQQALLIVGAAAVVFAVLYFVFFVVTLPPSLAKLKAGYVLTVRRKGGPVPGFRADWITLQEDIVEPVEPPGIICAIVWAVGLSLWASVRIGVGSINLSDWLVRLQRQDREIVTQGWVRTLVGVQSLLSNVAIALFIIAFFGRPFD